jgi:hypothetical protein
MALKQNRMADMQRTFQSSLSQITTRRKQKEELIDSIKSAYG